MTNTNSPIRRLIRLEWIRELGIELEADTQLANTLKPLNVHEIIFMVFNHTSLIDVHGRWDATDAISVLQERIAAVNGANPDTVSEALEHLYDQYDSFCNNICIQITNSVIAAGLSPYGWTIDDWAAEDIVKMSSLLPQTKLGG